MRPPGPISGAPPAGPGAGFPAGRGTDQPGPGYRQPINEPSGSLTGHLLGGGDDTPASRSTTTKVVITLLVIVVVVVGLGFAAATFAHDTVVDLFNGIIGKA